MSRFVFFSVRIGIETSGVVVDFDGDRWKQHCFSPLLFLRLRFLTIVQINVSHNEFSFSSSARTLVWFFVWIVKGGEGREKQRKKNPSSIGELFWEERLLFHSCSHYLFNADEATDRNYDSDQCGSIIFSASSCTFYEIILRTVISFQCAYSIRTWFRD